MGELGKGRGGGKLFGPARREPELVVNIPPHMLVLGDLSGNGNISWLTIVFNSVDMLLEREFRDTAEFTLLFSSANASQNAL